MPLTKDMSLVERALVTAYENHFKQTDLAGCPYIFHPIRVMEQMDTDDERAVALLHDVLEDSDLPVEHLAKWFPENVVEAVVAVTKPPRPEIDEEEDWDPDEVREALQMVYMGYIEQVAQNPLATKVKIADLRDNIRVDRLPKMTKGNIVRLKKYHKALTFLLESSQQ